MNETKIIKIATTELLGADTGISTEDGDRLFRRIDKALSNDAAVFVDFKNIKMITTAFLNAGIGQLYGKYAEKKIEQKLQVLGMEDLDREVLRKVVEVAKKYFEDPKGFNDSVNRVLEDDR